jgi:hypothetical protein
LKFENGVILTVLRHSTFDIRFFHPPKTEVFFSIKLAAFLAGGPPAAEHLKPEH